MKILHVAKLTNNRTSGVETVVPERIFYQNKVDNVESRLFNISSTDIRKNENDFVIYLNKKKFLKVIKEFNPDLVIFNEVYKIEYLYFSKILRNMDIEYAIMPHCSLTSEAQGRKSFKKYLANTLFFNKFINKAEFIHYLTELEKEKSDFYPKSVTSPNGVKYRSYKSKTLPKKIKFLYLGRFDIYQKGIDLMLNSIGLKKDELIKLNVEISLYGSGKEKEEEQLKFLIKENNLENLIKIFPSVYEEDKEKVLSDYSYLILNSRFEGLPTVVLEALSYNMPVIISEGTFISDIVKKYGAGFICSSENIADKMIEACCCDNYEDMTLNANKIICENYKWQDVINNELNEYKRVRKH